MTILSGNSRIKRNKGMNEKKSGVVLPRGRCPGGFAAQGLLFRIYCPRVAAQSLLPRGCCPGFAAQGLLPRYCCLGVAAQGFFKISNELRYLVMIAGIFQILFNILVW